MALTRRKINNLYKEKETSAAKQEKLDRFRAGYLKDTSAALPETKNPPVKISAGGFTEQASGDIRADLMQAADATRNAKSGNAAAAAIQGMSGYIGKDAEPKKEKDTATENIVFPVIPLSTASRANMVNAGLGDRVVKPEAKTTVSIMDAPVSLSLDAMNTVNKTAAGEAFRNTQKSQETAVLPGVTRPYTQVEQMQERRREDLREEKANLQKRISGLELVKETIREQVAELGDEQSDSLEKNNREGDSVEQRGAKIVDKRKMLEDTIAQIDIATNRIREIDEILNIPRETNIHPLAYQAARVGVGAVETAENWASSLAYTLGDALTDGAFSDNQKKVSDYLAQNPTLAEQLYTHIPSAAQRIANDAGVSVNDVEMFRKTTGAEYLREGLNSADNITAGMQAAGNIAETIGQMLPSILLTAGYTPANPAKPADGVAKFIASKITPAPGDAFIGASVYGGQLEALAKERGFDVSNYLNAAANSAVETAIEKAMGFSDAESFQRLFMPTGSTGKSILKGIANYIVTGSEEGLEEVVNVPLSEIIDRMTGASGRTNIIGEGGIFDVAEMAKSGLSGSAVGLIMGGVGGMAAVAGSVVESGNIRRGIAELSGLQKDLPEAYRVEIPDAKKVSLDEFNALSAKYLENLERFKDDLAAGKVTMPEETPVQDTTPTAEADTPTAEADTPTAEDNTPTETADVQTAKTEQNAPIYEDVAKTSEDVAKTEESAAISDEENIIDEDIETYDESVDEESPVAKSLRIAETDVYTAGNDLVNAYGGDVRKAVDALYAEGNRLVKDGSAEARARLNTVEAVRNDILSNNAKRVERNAGYLNKILTEYGIRNVTVDMELADREERGYYDPAAKTIHLSPKLSGSEAVNFVIAHELGHHAAAADSAIVNDIMNIVPKMVEKGIFSAERFSYNRYLGAYAQIASKHAASASGQVELKAYMDSGMTKEQAVQKIVEDYIHQEMASDFLGEIVQYPEILKKLRREDRTLWQRIVDALKDLAAKLTGKTETRQQEKMLETIRGILEGYSGEQFVYDNTNVKSATDSAGTFDSGNSDIRLSMELDADYMAAVESDDMETAQRMVDDAAKAAGYDSPKLYHGTNSFGFTKINTKMSDDGISFFATSHFPMAQSYSYEQGEKRISQKVDAGVYGLFGNTDNFLEIDADGSSWDYIEFTPPELSELYELQKEALHAFSEKQKEAKQYAKEHNILVSEAEYKIHGYDNAYDKTVEIEEQIEELKDKIGLSDITGTREIALYAKKNGYAGVVVRNVEDYGGETEMESYDPGDVYIFFRPQKQVKSADPVTYDDNGNVIPLSERFKDDNADIRFSKETRLTEENEYLKRQFVKRQGNEWAKAVEPKARRKYAAKLAGELKGVSASSIDAQLAKVWKVFEQPIRGGLDTMEVRYDEALKVAHEAAAELISGAKAANLNPLYEQYADLRKRLKDTAINPGSAKTDIPDYSEWRKESMGVLRLSDKGAPVERIWDELCGQYPEFFDASITDEAERIRVLADVANKLRAVPGNPMYVMDGISPEDADAAIGEMETALAHSILSGYDLIAEETYAAKAEKERVRGENASAKAYAQSMRDAENAQSNLENERIRTENAAKQAQAEAEGAILRYTNEANGILAKANDAVIKAQNFEKKVWADFTREYNALQVSWRKANRAVETAQQKVIREKRKAEDARRRQELAAVRKNFMGNLTRIYNMTVDPTKNKHVPDEMREAVASLLEQFAGTRLPSGKTVDYNILAGIGEDAYANAEKESIGRMERIFGVIKQKNHSSDGGVTQNFIRDMENQIAMLRDMYSEINMRSADGTVMRPDAATTKNIEYLRQCNRILSMLDKYIRDMNVNFLAGKAVNAHEMAQSVLQSLSKRKQESTDKFLSDVQYDFMTPETFLARLGPIGREITKAYRRAQNRQAAFEQSFTDYMKTLTGGKYSTYDVGFNGKLVELVGNDGKILKVPKDQIMELYVLWNRPAAKRHIRNGGVYFLDEHGKEIDTRRMVFDSGIEKVFDTLTDEDKRICDGIVRFLSTRCADWGNEASLYLYGYRKFGDTKYFPMNVSKSHLPGNWDQMDDFARLENLGFTKKLGDNASAPLRLGGIFNTADSHVRAMAAYSAYAPINNDVTRMVDMAGMKGNIEKYLGKRGYSYLTDFIKAVEQNKVRSGDNIAIAKGFDKLGNAYKRAAVSWNISTAVKQPISMVRALNAIDGKYIAKAYADLMKHKDAVDAVGRMVDASGVAKMKVLGYSDVGFGKSLRQNYDDSYSPMGDKQKNMVLRNLAKAYEGFTDAGMWMAGKMDEATWARIWRACELETADKYKGLTFAEQTQKTAERFNEVIGQTQVVDTILDNAPILRSEKASLYTAFMSEPVKSLNSLIAAHDAMVEKRPGAKKQLGKAVGTFVVSNILLEPLVSIVFSMFRDDEDETEFETVTEKALNLWVGVPAGKDGDKWLESDDGKERVDELISGGMSKTKAEAKAKREYIWGDFGVDFISSQVFSALTGAIPYVNGLVDAVTNTILGYDNDRIDMANISKAVRSTMNLAKAYNGAGEQQKSILNLWVTMLEDSAAIAGIPAKTFRRDLTAIYRTVLQATDSYNMQWELNKMLYNINSSTARTQKGFFDIMARAAKAGDTEAYKRMSDDLEEIIGSGSVGIKRSTITSQLEKRGYEPEIGSDIWYIDLQAGFDLDTFNTGMQAERMITDLYRKTKESSLLPKSPSDSFTVSGETVKITDPLEYQAFAEEVGDFSYMILVNMASSDGYKNLTDAQKQYAIEKAYDYARRRSRKRLYSAYDMGENLFKDLYEKNASPSSVANGILGKAKEKK